MTMKNSMIGIGFLVGAVVLAGALVTNAQAAPAAGPAPTALPLMAVQMDRDGRALLLGVVVGVASSSLTVLSWGGTWTVQVGSSTEMLPRAMGALSDFQVGDRVGVAGTASADRDWTIQAAAAYGLGAF